MVCRQCGVEMSSQPHPYRASEDDSHAELKGPRIADRRHRVERRHRFDGYEPGPKVVFRVTALTRLVRLKASTSPSSRLPPASRNERLTRRLMVKKSLPVPAFRGMNSTARTSKFAVDTEPSANGRPAVPCRLFTPETMLNGSDE